MQTIDDIRKIAVPILKKAGVRRAGIFGSIARGDAMPESDIDILFERTDMYGLFELVRMKRSLEDALERSVDLIDYRAIKPRIREAVLRDEVPLI